MTIKSDKWITRKSCPLLANFTHKAVLHMRNGEKEEYLFSLENYKHVLGEILSDPLMKTVERALRTGAGMAGDADENATLRISRLPKAVRPMIAPFQAASIRAVDDVKIISKGLSSYGYDVSLAETVKIFTNINAAVVDPKRFNERCLVDAEVHLDEDGVSKYAILPPNSYLLGSTIEYFHIPRNVTVVCLGKSTYARAGVIVNVTPAEAEFEGNVVIEISNATSLPIKVYVNEGISQFLFFESDEDCETSYADRGGKYQGQTGMTFAKV